MTFNSLSYFLFLPLVYSVYYVTTDRFRWLVLLCASYVFYAFFKAPHLILILGMVTAISYLCGIGLGRAGEKQRAYIFWIGVVACVVVLLGMKCLPLLIESGGSQDQRMSTLLLSVGVSYFTFQAISYLIDVYLEIQEPERHFGYHALAIAFFAKLLQGPIERAYDLLPQLRSPYTFNYDNIRRGLLLFAWGLFKKVVVADRLNLIVNSAYNDVHSYSGLSLILATYLYALQIYFDFSGYTDMALGSAKVFNISLSQNFNSPYFATSIADFWRRWHISFSRWILDYIFKPLQMQFRNWGKYGTASALLITFLVSGFWHGISWTFVVWGMLHGFFLAASVFYKPLQKNIYKRFGIEKNAIWNMWQIFVTFNLVSFAWIFFRANTLSDALYVVRHLFYGFDGKIQTFMLVSGKISLVILIMSLFVILVVNLLIKYCDLKNTFYDKPLWFRWTVYNGLLCILLACNIDSDNVFVYLRF